MTGKLQREEDPGSKLSRGALRPQKKKKGSQPREKEFRRDCERLRVPYDHPNNSEDEEARRKRLRAFVLEEEALQLECYKGQVEYVSYTHGEDTDGRRRRLREQISNRERSNTKQSEGDKIYECNLKNRCEDNGVSYLAPLLPQESVEAARIRRERLEELVKRFVHFDTCAACSGYLHSFCQFAP